MNRTGMPWMVLVLALLGWQVGGSSGGVNSPNNAAAANRAEKPAGPAPQPSASEAEKVAVEWPALREQIEAYFGRTASSGRPADLVAIAKLAQYRPPDVYLALVPDPLDSFLPARFDQVLAGIQEGFAEADFLLDRIALPWTAEEAKKPDPAYRSQPGMLIFRRPGRPGNGRLAIVFLVGETAKQGVHKRAFALALETARGFAEAGEGKRIRILGPSFSGSRESLRLAFDAWYRPGFPEVWLVSGSATSPKLDLCAFGCDRGVRFFRTVMDDGTLLKQGQDYLIEQLGWNRERIAMLSEADTGYGQGADSDDGSLVLKFPSGLSGLRKASEDAARGRTESKDTPRPGPSTLAISLADESRPVDVVPEFSRLTTPTKDMALSNLLAALCGQGQGYLGLVATDTRDRIFLAERVREICPDTQLFLLDSDLLLAHPQHRDALDGAIILSSSALFTRGLPWLEPRSPEPKAPDVRQFQSELHEGVVHAITALRADAEYPAVEGPARLEPPHAWVSAIGNGSIWPLARLPLPPEKTGAERGVGSKANALTLTCLLALIVLSVVLVRVARPLRQITDLPPGLRDRFPFLLALSAILIAWGVLQVVGGLPLWAFGRSWEQQEAMTHRALAVGSLFAFLGLMAFLLRDRLRAPQLPRLATSLRWIAIVCFTVAAGGLLAEPLLHTWMPGGIELFHFRARKFTGGLSPIVSLSWLGGGYFLWAILEMKRRTLVAFQGSTFPIPALRPEDPILPGCRKIAERLERRMMESSPTWPFWAVIALPALGAGVYLLKFIQPVAEARAYGQVFVGLAIGLFVLALISFQRFLRLWAELSGLLDRIETLDLCPTFKKLAPEVEWRPMKSFAWVIPPFKMTELSIAKLGAIEGAPDSVELRRLLADALEGHRIGDPKAEAAGRQALQTHFAATLAKAKSWLTPGPCQDFAAVRLISYVRTVFAHLRSSLLGALLPGFLLLLAISTYEMQPKRVLFLAIWSALAVAVLATIWTFVHMDRNPTLSAIGGSTAGEVDLDRSFVQSVLTYGVLPLLGLVATRFPQIERLLSGYLNPLMRFVNGGGG
ncbi:MAG TPA: hypothetical protein VGS22_15055 [Thermoanaerobaculia bacterium]|nr:hypothetical protein [Thermoanaerobaculia bacterium]